ncbi:uncharacterized beta-barrel protein YwiB (DUF1934 family) [Sedimentibacter acidaminivorans]|uniref:Uncharacterized beta-barrel protein YwiB (DUF1934 family) n=1 Tax=Sedimentibacter acidaminivorans TaxID=913099 RepID=A0ABS4GF76_9FIRM|nr:DUF1934 domain-containing protein [Sedimentibacter acidaminivorans]MBP1926350.1 uncharacterized beta-barrel protein YwiB (DUF1934 family) [Sedimentibacter acidaminivorans]
MEEVKIKITTIQTIDDAGNEDNIEMITEATLDKIDDCFIINYDESGLTETEGSRTRLKIYKNKMLLTKIGSFSSKMKFEEGNSYSDFYTTPYGSFDLDFLTVSYINNLDDNGRGSIEVEYKIVFGKTGESYNKLKINIYN